MNTGKTGAIFAALILALFCLVLTSCVKHKSPVAITIINTPASTIVFTETSTATDVPTLFVSPVFTATVTGTITSTATSTRTSTKFVTKTPTYTFSKTPTFSNTPTPLPFICTPIPTFTPVISGTGSISGNIQAESCSIYQYAGAIVKAFISGVEVSSTISNSSGNYTLSGLGTGTYDVLVKLPGYDDGNYITGVSVIDGANTPNINYIKTMSYIPGVILVEFGGMSDADARQIINNHCCTVIRGPVGWDDSYSIVVYEEDGQTTAGMIPVFQTEGATIAQPNYIFCPYTPPAP